MYILNQSYSLLSVSSETSSTAVSSFSNSSASTVLHEMSLLNDPNRFRPPPRLPIESRTKVSKFSSVKEFLIMEYALLFGPALFKNLLMRRTVGKPALRLNCSSTSGWSLAWVHKKLIGFSLKLLMDYLSIWRWTDLSPGDESSRFGRKVTMQRGFWRPTQYSFQV